MSQKLARAQEILRPATETKPKQKFSERALELIDRIGGKLFPADVFSNPQTQLALAGIPAGVPFDMNERILRLVNQTTFHFGTSSLPPNGSPRQRIMDWESVDVLLPGESPKNGSATIPYTKAYSEVDAIMRQSSASHEFIADEAINTCDFYGDVSRYRLHILTGAMAEDYKFLPGESLEDLCLEDGRNKLKGGTYEYDPTGINPGQVPGFLDNLFIAISDLWASISGKKDKDDLNSPSFGHFYDFTRPANERGLGLIGGDIQFVSALNRIIRYWHVASSYYENGDKPKAFYALGHIVHLVADLHVPAHTHNDPHGPTFVLGNLDSLEQWAARGGYDFNGKTAPVANIRFWPASSCLRGARVSPDTGWNQSNIDSKLTEFVNSLVVNTERFRSVDAEGTDTGEKRVGELSEAECFRQGTHLVPRAIANCGQLMANFVNYQMRNGQ